MDQQARLLDSQLKYVIEKSDFYRSKFQTESLSIRDFGNLEFTTKKEIIDDQDENGPFGSNLCVKPNEIQRIHKTSGTTCKPFLIALTAKDITKTVEVGASCFNLSGLSGNDTVVHCLNYNMWAGGYTDHQSLEKAGAAVIPFGVGKTVELIEMMLLIKPTAIHCTPSYLHKIAVILDESFGLKPSDLRIKLGLFGAEPGLENREFRANIESNWGMKAMNANYGLSEVLSMVAAECTLQAGLHFMGGKYLLPELLDDKNGRCIDIEDGAVGELVLTNLSKRAQPLIRYRTGDVVEIISASPCQCGTIGFRFRIIGRTDDMIVVKGVNIFVSTIAKVINEHLDVLTGQFQVHINKQKPYDKLIIVAEYRKATTEVENFTSMLQKKFSDRLFLKPQLQIVPEGTLPLVEGKSKKIFRVL